eukprot:2510156-Amphidinium_carterae.1
MYNVRREIRTLLKNLGYDSSLELRTDVDNAVSMNAEENAKDNFPATTDEIIPSKFRKEVFESPSDA